MDQLTEYKELKAVEKKIDDLRTKNEYNGVQITDKEEKKEIMADLKGQRILAN